MGAPTSVRHTVAKARAKARAKPLNGEAAIAEISRPAASGSSATRAVSRTSRVQQRSRLLMDSCPQSCCAEGTVLAGSARAQPCVKLNKPDVDFVTLVKK